MKKIGTKAYLYAVFVLMGTLLIASWAVNSTAHAAESVSRSQVSIAGNGQAIVRDALVTKVEGNTLTAVTAWGGVRLSWRVATSGSTRFAPSTSSDEWLTTIKVGDIIEFSGYLNSSGQTFAVQAAYVKNSSLMQESAVLDGDVVSIDRGTSELVLLANESELKVASGTGTFVLYEGDTASFGTIRKGDRIRAEGRLDLASGVLSAGRIDIVKHAASADAGEGSIYRQLLEWLSLSRGTMSMAQ